MLLALVMIPLVGSSMIAGAQDGSGGASRHTETTSVEVEKTAAAWGISTSEYRRFKEIMAGRRGSWTPDADPILALGTHATSQAEMRSYAEKYVKQEFERTERELAFQREVSAAWKRLFPSTPRIGSMPAERTANNLSQNMSLIADRVAVVVTSDCQGCTQAVQHYLGMVSGESPIQAVDIYVSNSKGDDKVLRDWVDSQRVPLDLLQTGKVTVNHAEAHSAITQFPTVFERQSNGKWQQKPSS